MVAEGHPWLHTSKRSEYKKEAAHLGLPRSQLFRTRRLLSATNGCAAACAGGLPPVHLGLRNKCAALVICHSLYRPLQSQITDQLAPEPRPMARQVR
jgi:hypothetical protein